MARYKVLPMYPVYLLPMYPVQTKSGVPKAKKALACKLAKAVWHVMNGKDFDEKLMFG
jgi:hypothetical protein